jgi:hypothetical protein
MQVCRCDRRPATGETRVRRVRRVRTKKKKKKKKKKKIDRLCQSALPPPLHHPSIEQENRPSLSAKEGPDVTRLNCPRGEGAPSLQHQRRGS